jgi:hypothetical protein
MRITFFFLYICSGLVFSISAQTAFTKGVIHDSIPVLGAANESFALYLPERYQENELSSIVFIFDPGARAAIGIGSFIEVSEKYGHILVCSNNSRNGPYERNFDIANNLFNHIFSNFTVKEDEMYISGFSGGSRLASAIASLTNKFAGVIGCGAGFSNIKEHMPSTQNYAYVGLCGDRDMNYRELLENKDYLNLIKFNSTLITYDGDHSWPPPEQISRAFDWLHLQKLKKSTPEGSKEILGLYKSDYDRIGPFKEAGALLYASEQYERILKSYSPMVSVDSLAKQYQELLGSADYKKRLASHTNVLKMERKLAGKLRAQITSDFKNPGETDFGWWEKELNKLNTLKKKKGVEVGKMVYRIKFDLFARAYSRKNALLHSSNKEQAALVDRFLDMLYPRKE